MADKPATWGVRSAAETRAKVLPKPFGLGGVGLEFSDLGDDRSTAGIDLDACRERETGKFEGWAEDVIGTFDSYTEVSPSQTGAKVFFTFDTQAWPVLRSALGTSKFGKQFKRGGGEHPPAIELHLGNRYFAVTDARLGGSSSVLRHIEAETILHLLKVDGPAFVGTSKPKTQKSAVSNDQSRSGVAFRKAAALVRCGCDFNAMVEGLQIDPETAEWTRDKGLVGDGRELTRLFQKVTAVLEHTPKWLSRCLRSENGAPMPVLANALLALRDDPAFDSLFSYDQMQRCTILSAPIPSVVLDHESDFEPHPVTDVDVTHLQERLQLSGLPRIGKDVMHQAVDARAYERSFHPVRNYLRSLEWDGKARISTWLADYLGAADTEYTKSIGAMFLISMVARIERPGCKSDYMLVLEGPQGAKKSSACRVLGGQWFSDAMPDIRSGKDVSQHLNGKWLIEVAEMSALDKAEAAALKAFVTRDVERYRPSYGRREATEPRQCVFIGTTNKTAYLRDETGGRRFWPVKCGTISIAALAQDRDQLLAEAMDRYREGYHWWPDAEFERTHVAPEQSARYESDAWEDQICHWLDGVRVLPGSIEWQGKHLEEVCCTVLMVARLALHMDAQKVGTADQRRIIAALERLGWVKGKRTMTGQLYIPGPAGEAGFQAREGERKGRAAQLAAEKSM